VYWHSELAGKDRYYHLNKTEKCEKQGIQLLHIFETDWMFKKEIIKSIIKSKLGLNERIFARKCEITQIPSKTARVFIEENHRQGKDNSKIYWGLIHNEELVSVMSFSVPRYNKKNDWELVRFCNKKGLNVVGGASRLLKGFRRENPGSIVSYADRRYSDGGLYKALGFELKVNSQPNYFYFKKPSFELYSRIKFQKHKLEGILENYDSGMTEWQNMKFNGWNRIWDCGNLVFSMK
jgi:hypothetical protein